MEIIREDVFRKQLKKGAAGGYLLFGEEDYLKSFAVKAAREAICPDPTFALFNDVRLDALDYSAPALLDALMPPPMMSDKKLVTVSGLHLGALKASELDELCEALAALPEYDYNVLLISVPAGQMEEGRLPKNPSPLLKRLSEYLTPVQFETVSGARLVSWVGKHFEHNGVSADTSVCAYLIDYCGKSMFTLSAETEKLSYYVLGQGRDQVTKADVEQVSVSELSADSFALANAVLEGRYEDAMRVLEVMRFRRIEPVIVLSDVSGAICDMIAVKALMEDGCHVGEAAALLASLPNRSWRMSDYKTRLYWNAVAGKSMKRLRRAAQLCSEADLALKRSPQGYIAIERLICSL